MNDLKFYRIIEFTKQKLNYLKYYNRIIKKQDLIVVNGGGLLKFKVQFFGASLKALLDIAGRRSIPAVFNSIGVEGFDNNSFKCQVLKRIVRHKALQAFPHETISQPLNSDISKIHHRYHAI